MMRVAVLGPKGTFSEEAVQDFFGRIGVAAELKLYKQFPDVFLSTVQGITDVSAIPIENTIDGSVSTNTDWLIHEVDLQIVAEWIHPVVQNLVGFPDSENREHPIRKVYSYPVAISQCHQYLRKHLPYAELESVSSTAEGIRLVQEGNDPSVAAIGTALAAKAYGLAVLASGIQDHNNNFTRFLLIGQPLPKTIVHRQHKTSILVTLPEDYPGALHQVLSAFSWRRINLSRIESRPTRKKLGNYFFFIDMEESLDNPLLALAIEEIETIGCHVRVLGSYPSYHEMNGVEPNGPSHLS